MKIFVITHKDYTFPSEGYYIPLQVGPNSLNSQYLRDNTGDNIAVLNQSFCELTALYWIWKNVSTDIVGLVHYRRYFSAENDSGINFIKSKIIDENEIISKLQHSDILIPKPRNYFIFSIRKHYAKAHFESDLIKLEKVILKRCPEYKNAFDSVMDNTKLSLYNMFICKKVIIDEYCQWLFPILFDLKDNIDITHYDKYQKRIFGFLGERLFNIWLVHNSGKYSQGYIPVRNIEGENLPLKAIGLLKRHLLKR
ncbi:DUF4422 domain-containing protein [Mangrovibacter phragmitis]|uniref:DUF4422 domain-containing protein n=1 Tax=Mangrovibacter phragmitis TaxID=1691903 RepID=UPI003517F6A3